MAILTVVKLCILFLFTGGCLAEAGDHPNITLYDLDNFKGSNLSTTREIADLGSFNNKVNSVCGRGLWFLYANPTFSKESSFVYTFAYNEYTCENLDITQANQVSSIRYAGGFSIYEESLSMYKDFNFCGGELVTMKNIVNVGDYTGDLSSFVVIGNSSWTIYRGRNYEGDSVCLEPSIKNNLVYGLFDANSLGFPDNSAESVRKGCYSSKKAKQINIK